MKGSGLGPFLEIVRLKSLESKMGFNPGGGRPVSRRSRDHSPNPSVESPSEIAFLSGFPGNDVAPSHAEADLLDEILPACPDHLLAETVGEPLLVEDAATNSRVYLRPGIQTLLQPACHVADQENGRGESLR